MRPYFVLSNSCTAYSCELVAVFKCKLFRFLNRSVAVIICFSFSFHRKLTTLPISFSDEIRILCYFTQASFPLFLRAKILPIHFLYYKLLAKTMHDVNNDVIPSQLKDLFIPTAKIHSYNTRSSVSNNFYIKKSKLEIERKSFSRIGAKLWNEIRTKLRTLPKLIFKRKIRMILFNIVESEDSYEDLESIFSKVRKYS